MDDSEFKNIVWEYYRKNRRIMPWRETDDEYRIVVSEVMLQQTQVSRVLIKYKEFIEVFPTWKSLSEAALAEVLKHWSGLGYNNRAKRLWETARIIHADYADKLPQDTEEMDRLPGIGSATAASVLVFSHNLPLVFIETNIRRVYLHHYFPKQVNVKDWELLPIVERTLDMSNPREWYYALMDYGAFLGRTIDNPNKRSKTYSRQSPFEGSVRKIRGEIM